jgi:hypothetical protein
VTRTFDISIYESNELAVGLCFVRLLKIPAQKVSEFLTGCDLAGNHHWLYSLLEVLIILYHVDPLLGNDRETGNDGVFYVIRAEQL